MIVRAPAEQFVTAPEGSFAAVCVDSIDLGELPNPFNPEKPRHMVRLVWQIEEQQSDGKPYHIKQDYTASLHEKAKLRQDLQSWRGRAFSFDELVGFDLETLIGVPCLLNIVHAQGRKGGTFANVGAIMKLPRNMTAPATRDYVRVKDRGVAPVATTRGPNPTRPVPRPIEEQPLDDPFNSMGITDDDVPF